MPNTGFVCRDCMRLLRRSGHATIKSSKLPRRALSNTATTKDRPLRVGIIGSGPAGFYAALRLIEKGQNTLVDMYEQLPAPFGLVRYGVAPDHPEVKNCQDRFVEVARSPGFQFIGNVAVGEQVPLRALRPHYDALLFAYGASRDRTLGIPGEDLKGVVSARAFVGWYNGLPEYEGLNPNLEVEDTAHIIGNGNVALDVARVLLSGVDRLKGTDISDQALATLSKSRIKHVHIYGRRGPMQAAFTIKEIRELMTLPNTAFEPIDKMLLPDAEWISNLPRLEQRKYRLAALLAKGTPSSPTDPGVQRSWSLRSLLSPIELKPTTADPTQLGEMVLDRTSYDDPTLTFKPTARVHPTNNHLTTPANLLFRSIGYASESLPGLTADLGVPFDVKRGIIPNDMHGRVISASSGPGPLTAKHVEGCYTTGWVKNGPTGVIASTMEDAFQSADVVLRDWEEEVKFLNGTRSNSDGTGRGWESVLEEAGVKGKGVRRVSWEDWRRIDEVERERGRRVGKVREKFKSTKEMLVVLD